MSIYNEIRPARNHMKRFLPILFAASVAYAAGAPSKFVMTDTNGVLALPATFISSNAAAIAAALPSLPIYNADAVILDSPTTTTVYEHARGAAEMVGDNEMYSTLKSIGFSVLMTSDTAFSKIYANIRSRTGTSDVTLRVFEQFSATSAFDVTTNNAILTKVIPAAEFPTTASTNNSFDLGKTVFVRNTKYCVVVFTCDTADVIAAARWGVVESSPARPLVIVGTGNAVDVGVLYQTSIKLVLDKPGTISLAGTTYDPAGDSVFNTQQVIGISEFQAIGGEFDTIYANIAGVTAAAGIELRIFIRPTVPTDGFNPITTKPAHVEFYPAAVCPRINGTNQWDLSKTLTVANNQYILAVWSSFSHNISHRKWATQNSGSTRGTFFYAATAGAGALTKAAAPYYSTGFQLAKRFAGTGVLQSTASDHESRIAAIETVPIFDLAGTYTTFVGDTLQLFKRGYLNSFNADEPTSVSATIGNDFGRYYEFTPTNAGTYNLSFTRFNRVGKPVERVTPTLNVKSPASGPAAMKHILVIGDSLTANYDWVAESWRRICATGGTPVGLGYTNITFIGTDGTAPAQREGNAGWTWSSYVGTNSPFWNTNTSAISFTNYCAANSFTNIDSVYILLGWNEVLSVDYGADPANGYGGVFGNIYTLLKPLRTEYPNAKVRLIGLQVPSLNGGLGENYGATAQASRAKMIRSVHAWNANLKLVANNSFFGGVCRYIDLAGQFDSENNMPAAAHEVNTRSSTTELRGNNGVHPATEGYLQIADAVARDVVWDWCQ